MPSTSPPPTASPNETSCCAARTGSDLRTRAWISVKIAVLAPIPSARDKTATVGEARALAQLPQRIAQVLDQAVHACTSAISFFSSSSATTLPSNRCTSRCGVLGEARIVRHHADGRAFAVQVLQAVPSRLRRCANPGFRSVRQPAGSKAFRPARAPRRRAAADRRRAATDSAARDAPCRRAPALPSRASCARRAGIFCR